MRAEPLSRDEWALAFVWAGWMHWLSCDTVARMANGNGTEPLNLGSARTTAKGDASEPPAPATQADVVNAERAQHTKPRWLEISPRMAPELQAIIRKIVAATKQRAA